MKKVRKKSRIEGIKEWNINEGENWKRIKRINENES